jgi:hypothetical protein
MLSLAIWLPRHSANNVFKGLLLAYLTHRLFLTPGQSMDLSIQIQF